jgi:hypothetical protein
MPKKRSSRRRQQAQRQARVANRRLAREEQGREAHAQLVVERSGDPRFVQRARLPDGQAVVSWAPDAGAGPQLREAIEAQTRAFRARFGREPGSDDPVFFDPAADDPAPATGRQWNAGMAAMAKAAADAGLDRAYVEAWQEVGYLVTEANQHLFSAVEVQADLDAVARCQDDGDDGLLRLDWQVPAVAAGGLRVVIAETLAEEDAEPGLALRAALEDTDDADAAGLAATAVAGVLLGWLAAVRQRVGPAVASGALAWISDHLGPEEARRGLVVARVLGHPLAPDLTVAQTFDQPGDDMVPALVWPTAGLTATTGDGDPEWLSQFDPTRRSKVPLR